MAKRRPTNLLNQQVNAAIHSQISPYQSSINAANTQYANEKAQIAHGETALQNELAHSGKQIAGRSANLLNAAAAQATGSHADIQKNIDFLKSVFSGYAEHVDPILNAGSRLVGARADYNAVNNATGLGLDAAGVQRDTGLFSGAAAARRGEDMHSALFANQQRTRQLLDQINAVKANAPFLRRQFQSQNLDNLLKKNQAQLQRDQFEEGKSEFQTSQNNQLAIAGANDQAAYDKSSANAIAKQNAAWAKTAQGVYKTLYHQDYRYDKDGNQIGNQKVTVAPKNPFGDSFDALTNMGLPGNQAVKWAMKWAKGSINNDPTWGWGGTQGDKVHAANNVLTMLKASGVGASAAKSVLQAAYGKYGGWKIVMSFGPVAHTKNFNDYYKNI